MRWTRVREIVAGAVLALLIVPAMANADEMSACAEDELLVYLNRADLADQAMKDAGVNSKAAANIFSYRAGPDVEIGTDDDEYFDDISELDDIGFVGPAALKQLAGIVASRCEHPSIRLGSWNIKKLGHGSKKDYRLVARIIDEKFDVLGVVEVMQKDGAHPGYDALVAALDDVSGEWESLVTSSPRTKTSAGFAEFYAVFWRQGAARPCPSWEVELRYTDDNDGSGSGAGPDVFSREPAYVCMEAGPVNPSVDFMLGVYHALHEGSAKKIQAEVKHIDQVFLQMMRDKKDEWDLFLMGDFNLRPKKLLPCTEARDYTTASPSTLNSSGELGKNEYDHMLVMWDDESTELIEPAEVLDVRYYAASRKEFFETVSDHLPIRVRVRIDGTDDD